MIPTLELIPILAGAKGTSDDWTKTALKVAAFGGILLGGRLLLRPLFRYIAASGVREIFTATALLVVLGAALFMMNALGLSMALGTFIAGVLRVVSEYRHELEISIEPFKGLLLGLFFILVGMELNIGIFYIHLAEVLIGVLLLVTIKSVVLYSLARIFGVRRAVRLQFSGVLSQGGEFAFVLLSAAGAQQVLQPDTLSLLLVVVTLSMMTTSLLMQIIDHILARRYNAKDEDAETPQVEDGEPQVIIVGFGRFGQMIGRLLIANKMRITVLERDVSTLSVLRRYGLVIRCITAMLLSWSY